MPTEAVDTENTMGNRGAETFQDLMENLNRDVQVKRLGKTELPVRRVTTNHAHTSIARLNRQEKWESSQEPEAKGREKLVRRSFRAPTGNMLVSTGALTGDESAGEYYCNLGVQEKIWKKIKRNAFRHAEFLDLHGYNRPQALAKLAAYLERCRMKKERYAIVIHGKGIHSPTKGSALKDLTLRFLANHPQVQAFCPAIASKGGSGATYVRMKV